MGTHQNLKVVQELYAAFERKDADVLRKVLRTDVEWVQCAGFPGGDRRRGADEVLSKVFGGLRSE